MSFSIISAEHGKRIRAIAIAAVSAALLITTATGLDGAMASSSGGPSAVAAKKCKKKKKKKCKKASPVARATAFLAGSALSRVSYSTTTGASSTTRYDFCRNGTFHFRGDYVGYSGYAWADSYDGTWSVTSATASSAQVAYTTSNYQVSDPFYASPPPSSGSIGVAAASETVVYLDGVEFSRSAGAC